MENRIDELHDDILVHVLSFLSLKEAGRTSILSKRWRNVWAYLPTLNFDNDKVLIDYLDDCEEKSLSLVLQEEPKYIRWVEQVLSSHKAPTIDGFKVQFNLRSSRKDNVDSWVRSAMNKRVKRFQLSVEPTRFGPIRKLGVDYRLIYTFPSISFNFLTSLELAMVNVSGDVLEKLLHDCPLEHLSVYRPPRLVNLKVVGPSLKLKTFRLSIFGKEAAIPDLEISAPNLTSFHYYGRVLNFPFNSSPKLTEILMGGDYGTHLLNDFSSLSSYASQIELLTLEASFNTKHIRIAEVFPVCSRLKTLKVSIVPKFDDQLFGLLSVIKACPLLHKFVLEFHSYLRKLKRTAKTRNVKACPHPCLKILEIIGFVGGEVDYKFVEYLIENAVSLEKIIIEPPIYATDDEPCLEKRETIAREQAEQLRANLRPGTELKIRNEHLPYKWLPF